MDIKEITIDEFRKIDKEYIEFLYLGNKKPPQGKYIASYRPYNSPVITVAMYYLAGEYQIEKFYSYSDAFMWLNGIKVNNICGRPVRHE